MNFNFSNYDSHSNLDEYLRLKKRVYKPKDHFFFRQETFYNLATNIEELDRESSFGSKIIDSLRWKIAAPAISWGIVFSAFVERFQGDGLYILDEPEAALSPLRQISMLARINGACSTRIPIHHFHPFPDHHGLSGC